MTPRASFVVFVAVSVAVAAVRAQTPDLDAEFAAAQPPTAESLWTLVPWRHSLTEALAEAKRDHKPIYLFVNDGDVESGRC
ncbi:MAG: hypothetical protein KDE27_20650 [Planctomycetes bacterium]|nr:hypothetical protein [Planctomycetota bacterium]